MSNAITSNAVLPRPVTWMQSSSAPSTRKLVMSYFSQHTRPKIIDKTRTTKYHRKSSSTSRQSSAVKQLCRRVRAAASRCRNWSATAVDRGGRCALFKYVFRRSVDPGGGGGRGHLVLSVYLTIRRHINAQQQQIWPSSVYHRGITAELHKSSNFMLLRRYLSRIAPFSIREYDSV